MRHLGEALAYAARNVPDRRVFRRELGILLLKPKELRLPQVVVAVANRRLVQVVVVAVGLLYQPPQLRNALLDLAFGHLLTTEHLHSFAFL